MCGLRWTKVTRVVTFDGDLKEAHAPMSVTLTLADEIDISRGDMIVKEDNRPQVSQDITMMICWMSPRPLQINGKYAGEQYK